MQMYAWVVKMPTKRLSFPKTVIYDAPMKKSDFLWVALPEAGLEHLHLQMGDAVVANGLVWIGANNTAPRDPELKREAAVLMCFRESDGQFLYQYVVPAKPGPLLPVSRLGFNGSPLIEGQRLWLAAHHLTVDGVSWRIIIEQLLRRDPDTQAWQQVARSGHTTFLRQNFEARVLAFGVYDQGKFDPFISQGTMPLPREATQPILTALYVIQKTRKELSPISRKATDGHWLVIVPAVYTTALALFSLEPAAQQVLLVRDLHYDFERANRRVLERGVRQPDQLVFPHRALFEQHTDTGPLA